MRRLMAFGMALGLGVGAVGAGCGPKDGVVSYRFGLTPVASLSLPNPDQVQVRPLDLARASGLCLADVAAQSFDVTIENLPPLESSAGAFYRLVAVVGPNTITPKASLDRLWRAVSPIGTAWAGAAEVEVVIGKVEPNPQGFARVVSLSPEFDVDKVEGARVEIAVPLAGGAVVAFRVLEGVMGNLESPASAAPAASGGHNH